MSPERQPQPWRRSAVGWECRTGAAEHHTMAGREFVRYRFMLRPGWAPERWHVIEQAGYCRVHDGVITRMDLACTGYFPIEDEVA